MKPRAPAIQLYYRDWMSHPGLRMCSIAARGLWADMMCIMAEGTPYGYLKAAGKDILPAILARRVGESLPDVDRWLAELLEHEVCQRDEHGTIYSPRMVRAEHLRQVRGSGGHKSQDNPNVPRRKASSEGGDMDILTPSEKDTSQPSPAVAVAVASAVTPSPSSDAERRFLDALPKKANRQTWEAIIRGWRDGQGLSQLAPATQEDIDTGLTDYMAGKDRDFNVAHVRTFIERVRDNRKKKAKQNGGQPHVDATHLWALIKSRRLIPLGLGPHAETLETEIASMVEDREIANAADFKKTLARLDFRVLQRTSTDRDAVNYITSRLNGHAHA